MHNARLMPSPAPHISPLPVVLKTPVPALPVVLKTPVPVTIPTPQVQVVNGPDTWAVAGTIAAIAAALVALVTLFAVIRQIVIANRQLKIANDALGLAYDQVGIANKQLMQGREELDYVREDLELTRQQIREIARRPHLDILFANGTKSVIYRSDIFGGQYDIQLPLQMRNTGIRSSTNRQVVFFVPVSVVVNPQAKRHDIDGIECVRFPIESQTRLYPDDSISFGSPTMRLRIEADAQLRFFYRIYDDFGSYPLDAEYGELTVQAEWINPLKPQKGFH